MAYWPRGTKTMALPNAAEVYTTRRAAIQLQAAELVALLNAIPEETSDVNWGHVGDLGRMQELLQQAIDMAARTGEYAAMR